MSRSAEEAQEVGRENNNERRFDNRIKNPLVPTYTIDDSNAAHSRSLISQPMRTRPMEAKWPMEWRKRRSTSFGVYED